MGWRLGSVKTFSVLRMSTGSAMSRESSVTSPSVAVIVVMMVLELSVLVFMVVSDAVLEPMTMTLGTTWPAPVVVFEAVLALVDMRPVLKFRRRNALVAVEMRSSVGPDCEFTVILPLVEVELVVGCPLWTVAAEELLEEWPVVLELELRLVLVPVPVPGDVLNVALMLLGRREDGVEDWPWCSGLDTRLSVPLCNKKQFVSN